MAKKFASRISKKARQYVDLSDKINTSSIISKANARLLEGAKLLEINLDEIKVKDQVRTKFNLDSLKDLSKNIEMNGLIQPLVVHLEHDRYTLICGERRFRAMHLIEMQNCPCFVLKNKTEKELMAIQFSENSSREELHYIDKADGILNYQNTTTSSERKITQALGISKSEVHRSLMIAKLDSNVKEAAKKYNTEKYVLLEFDSIQDKKIKDIVLNKILLGQITKRAQLRRIIKKFIDPTTSTAKLSTRKKPAIPPGVTANTLLNIMKKQSQSMNLDPVAQKALKELLKTTTEIMDF